MTSILVNRRKAMSTEPIPFYGHYELDPEVAYLEAVIEELYGKNPENVPKYVVLGDGSLYIFHKEEDRYAICEQTPPLQEGISATESSGGTTLTQCTGACKVCCGQNGHGQKQQW